MKAGTTVSTAYSEEEDVSLFEFSTTDDESSFTDDTPGVTTSGLNAGEFGSFLGQSKCNRV